MAAVSSSFVATLSTASSKKGSVATGVFLVQNGFKYYRKMSNTYEGYLK